MTIKKMALGTVGARKRQLLQYVSFMRIGRRTKVLLCSCLLDAALVNGLV